MLNHLLAQGWTYTKATDTYRHTTMEASRKFPKLTFKTKRYLLARLKQGKAWFPLKQGKAWFPHIAEPTPDTQYIVKIHQNILINCRPRQREHYLNVFWACIYLEYHDIAAKRLESYFHRRLGATWAKR